MSSLRQQLVAYLRLRRSSGVQLVRQGQALESFVHYAESHGRSVITASLAIAWAVSPARAAPSTHASRLALVRQFARFCQVRQPATEVPPDGIFSQRYRRVPPHIYSDVEISNLMAAARGLRSKRGLRHLTYETVIGIMLAAGLRISEVIALDDGSVDMQGCVMTIHNSKLEKTRHLPIKASTRGAISAYIRERNFRIPDRSSQALLITEKGSTLSQNGVRWTFHRMLADAGIGRPSPCRRPRLHDLRHTFAVRTLIGWYEGGANVEALLPRLATYLGHAHINDTYWYLSAVPELLQCVVRRTEQDAQGEVR